MPNMDKIFKQASQNAKAKDAVGIKRSPIGSGAGVKAPAFNPSKPNNMGSVFAEAKKNAAVKDMTKNVPEKKLPPLFPAPVKPMARPWETPLPAKPVSTPSKLDHMLYGAAKSTGAGYANFGGTMLDALQKKNSYTAGQQRRLDNDKTYLNSLKLQLSQTHHPVERAKLEETIRRKEKDISVLENLMREQGKYTQKGVDVAQGKADEWARESAEHVAKAKDGMGKVGQFAVDLGVAGTQMLGDAVTGGLPSMFVRAAGSGMQEARLAGADIGKQMAYGIGSGALATATEKISNASPIFKKAFGKGILDDAVKRLTGEFGATKAGQIITSALGEGGEELLESIVQPFLQRATYDPKAKFEAESAIHDFLIGAAMGGIGGTAGVVQTSKLGKELNSLGLDAEDTKAFIDTGLESTEGTKSHALAERAQSKTKEDGTLSDYDLGSLYKANVGAVAEENGQKPVAPTYEPPEDRQEATQKPSDGLEAPKVGTDTPNAVNDILEHGKRVEQSKLTNDEFNSMADRGDVAMDAEQKIYKVNPEQHIDQRGPQHTRNPRVNAFQFDHPELHDYYAPAAQELLVELEGYQPGGQTQLATGEYGQTYSWRSKRQASTRIAALLDAGMSRDRIASALDAIINNHGAENYADAKRVEFILDDMLSNGYNDGSKFVSANQNYVNDKAAIPGNKSAEYGHGLDDIDADGGDGLGAADAGSLNSDYDDLQAQSSEFYPEGANAARPVDTPVYGFDGRRISRAANNMMGAQAIPDDVVPKLEQFTADGLASYKSESDQKALDRADSTIRSKGWEGSLEYFRNAVNEGKAGKDLTAIGMKLINNAANAKDGNALAELFTLYSKLSVNTAQGLQAMSMFRKLSPESQLYGIQKIAESIPRKIDTRRKRGKSENVPVEEWMQRTGELLAKRLEAITKSEPERVQSLTESILSDITRYAKKGVTEGEKGGVRKRSEADRLYDLFNNYRQYNEAWDAAKAKIEQEYGDNPDAIKAFEDWLENDIASAAMSDSIGETVKISPALMNKFLEQTDQEGRDAVMQEIYQDIADQLPADFREKANAWRYMAMLLNPTTHIRNMMGNAIQAGTRNVKNAVKVAVEKQMGVSQDERTAAILGNSPADVARRGFAKTMYEQDLKAAMGERKWQDGPAGVMSQVQDIRQKQTWGKVPEKGGKWSPGAVTQAVINKGGSALEVEDKWFNERAYVQSLAQALKARGITAEEAQANPNDPRVMSAREYAITEAQKATYRNATQLSDALSKAGNYRGDNKVVKGASFAFNAIMPFRRTPANILTTSFDYSPIGIIKAVSHMGKKLESGEVTAAQVADELSAGLTGTGIMLVGAALAYAGLLQTSIGGGDDKKEKDFRRQTGEQDYSLNIFGHSYTLDWAVPTAMPLFAGAGFIEEAKDKDRAWTDLIGSLANVATEITFETSMLSAIDKIMKRVSYEENWPEYIASEVASSYASQFIPTIGGKVASIFDPSVRRTETSEGAGTLQKQAERFVQSAQRKIPGARNLMEPMIDRWGQEVSNGSPVGRTFQALVSPGFMKSKSNDAVDKEILRLKESTSNSAVFPPAYAKKISYTDKDHILHEKTFTSKEYTEYSKAVGQSRKELLDSAVGSSWYKAMPDGKKAEYLHDLYSYSKAQADWKYGIMSGDDWMHNVKDAQKELGVSPAQFIALASEYGSRAFSGKPYENLKSVLKTGLPIEDYFRFKEEAKGLNTRKHKTKDGWKQYSTDSIDSREVDMWAKKNGLTREQKNALKKTI